MALAIGWLALPVRAQDGTILDAREAFRKKDSGRLAAARATAAAERNPLAMWVDYWELTNRISDAQQDELDAVRRSAGPARYVEDRLRNDWLLELGRRRDWDNFAAEYPRFRMNDDREVSVLRAADRPPRRQGRCTTPRSPHGWRSATPTTAARCWPPTLYDAEQLASRRRLAQGAPRDRGGPARAPRARPWR